MSQESTGTPNPNDILEKEGLFEYHRYLVEGMRTNGDGKVISFDILDNEHNRNALEEDCQMTNKDKLMVDYISQLADGFEDERAGIAGLMAMTISLGCKYQKVHNNGSCKGCPLTSYVCRAISGQSKLLLASVNEEDLNL